MGETRVDLLHLLEDLRDAYPCAAEETILSEIVANSLDSGAVTIAIATDPAGSTLTIVDDGTGMRRRHLARYHDLAATTKVRGEGIGFAGVGIKVGLLVSEEVLTEARLGKHHMATVWRLASRHRAPWKWVPPPGLVDGRGTAVRLQLRNPLSPLLDPGFIEGTLHRHYQPLLDPALAEILASHYPHGVRFIVKRPNPSTRDWRDHRTGADRGAPCAKTATGSHGLSGARPAAAPRGAPRRRDQHVRQGHQARVGLAGDHAVVARPRRRIDRGSALAQALTLNKADFIRVGARGAIYLAYRKAIQEAVARQLALWGDVHEAAPPARRRATRPLERDLEVVLLDLADEFPLLATLVERRAGGQRSLPIGRGPGEPHTTEALGAPFGEPGNSAPEAMAEREDHRGPESAAPSARESPPPSPPTVEIPATRGPRKPTRYGLRIQFEQRPEDLDVARLVETTVWINEAHPAYRRAVASRSEGYHMAVASAMALAPLAVEPEKEHRFISAFLASWGTASDQRRGRSKR